MTPKEKEWMRTLLGAELHETCSRSYPEELTVLAIIKIVTESNTFFFSFLVNNINK